MSADFHLLIPARMASTRLPDKPLALLGGRPLVLRVLDCARAAGAASVHVATDSVEIAAVVRAAGGQVLMTAAEHVSGTDRLAEAVVALGLDDQAIAVNLQGDEPLMPAACLDQVAALLRADPEAQLATLWQPIDDVTEWQDPNVVKLVADHRGRALYFSRAPIPHPRGRAFASGGSRRHVGLYAYRVGALRQWPQLPPSPLEQLECLEQLRALSAGWRIACARACADIPAGIDTAEDLARVQSLYEALTRDED